MLSSVMRISGVAGSRRHRFRPSFGVYDLLLPRLWFGSQRGSNRQLNALSCDHVDTRRHAYPSGIAGIVLTVGMAVDANVLIFSRIREELKNHPPQMAIQAGFDRALLTITDANVTTFFVAIILLSIGSGPVRGFAVTLAVGIVTSMFTAILVTRAS